MNSANVMIQINWIPYDDSKDVDAVLHPLVDVLNGFKDLLFSSSEAASPS